MIGDGAIGGALRVSSATNAPGSVLLRGSEALAFEGGAQFAFTAWVRVSGPQEGNPVVFSNKDWRDGSNPGVAFAASQGVDMSRVGHWHYDYKKRGNHRDFMFNCGREGGRREDSARRLLARAQDRAWLLVIRDSQPATPVRDTRPTQQLHGLSFGRRRG